MYTTTPQELVQLALKKTGVLAAGQVPLADDIKDAFSELNILLASWNRRRWMVYHLVTASLVSTGAASYTVGPGGDFVTPIRPDKIESAYARQTNVVPLTPDYPLGIIAAMEDYNRIRLKGLTTFPQYVFYDSAYPLGNLYVWPIPQASLFEIFISVKDTLTSVSPSQMTLNLPPEYFNAILYNLAVRLRASYQIPMDPGLIALAEDGLAVIRQGTVQIPRLRLPANLAGRGGSYDPYGDRGGA